MRFTTQQTLFLIAFALSVSTLLLHSLALSISEGISVHDPISALSQGEWRALHTAGITALGAAQLLIAVSLRGMDHGKFWPFALGLLAIAGLSLFYVAYHFAFAPPAALFGLGANDPLWLVASVVGGAMGLFQPGFARLVPWLGKFNLACLGIWLLLIPATLLIGMLSLGVYERAVGVVYVAWVAGVSVAMAARSNTTWNDTP